MQFQRYTLGRDPKPTIREIPVEDYEFLSWDEVIEGIPELSLDDTFDVYALGAPYKTHPTGSTVVQSGKVFWVEERPKAGIAISVKGETPSYTVTASGVGCEMCPELCADRTQIVEGVGSYRPKVMVIAEAPGREEDEYGTPFVGASGQLLHATLSELGLLRADYYCTNAVRCRPPNNRDPKPEELENCRYWLLEEIDRVKPENILLLGRIAASQRAYIEQCYKGKIYEAAHPAYLLRAPAKRPEWRNQLAKIVSTILGGAAESAPTSPPVTGWTRQAPDIQSESLAIDVETDDLEEGYAKRVVTLQVASEDRAELYEVMYPLAVSGERRLRIRKSINPWSLETGDTGSMGDSAQARLAPSREWQTFGCGSLVPQSPVLQLAPHFAAIPPGELERLAGSDHWPDSEWWSANDRHHWYHNVKYDGPLVGLDLYDFSKWDDSALIAYVLRYPRVGLKEIGPAITGIPMRPIKEVIGTGKTRRPFSQALNEDYESASVYALTDGVVTARLGPYLYQRLCREPVLFNYYQEFEKPTVPVVAKLEALGVRVDPDRLQTLAATLLDEAHQATTSLASLLAAPDGINWNSNRQVAKLFVENGFALRDKTPTGELSLDKKALLGYLRVDSPENLKPEVPEHQVVQAFMHYKTMTKLRSTYALALLDCRDENSRVHGRFNQMVTDTNRFSSSDPNLQNIPIRNPLLGKAFRRCFVARPGHVFVKADFSQLELRIYAHYTQEPILVRAYTHTSHDTSAPDGSCLGCDVHQQIANEFVEFGVPRWRAKNGIFAAIYQAEADQLARTFGIPPDRARAFHTLLKLRLPSLGGTWRDSVSATLASQGYVDTLFGWRNYYPLFMSPIRREQKEALRAAANMPIQGTAGGVLKRLLISTDQESDAYGAGLVLTVHDEVVYEVPIGQEVRWGRRLEELGREAGRGLGVPLKLEVQIGPDWGTLTPLEAWGK